MIHLARRPPALIFAAAAVVVAGVTVLTGCSGAPGSQPAKRAAAASASPHMWETAREVPGTATLNTGKDAWITSVSCPSAGNCSAGGAYLDGTSHQAFVVNQTNGSWRQAEEVPGTAALNKTYAQINSVSCPSAGHCSAGGIYTSQKPPPARSGELPPPPPTQAFVVSET